MKLNTQRLALTPTLAAVLFMLCIVGAAYTEYDSYCSEHFYYTGFDNSFAEVTCSGFAERIVKQEVKKQKELEDARDRLTR